MLAQIKQSDFAAAKQKIHCPHADFLLYIVFAANLDILWLPYNIVHERRLGIKCTAAYKSKIVEQRRQPL